VLQRFFSLDLGLSLGASLLRASLLSPCWSLGEPGMLLGGLLLDKFGAVLLRLPLRSQPSWEFGRYGLWNLGLCLFVFPLTLGVPHHYRLSSYDGSHIPSVGESSDVGRCGNQRCCTHASSSSAQCADESARGQSGGEGILEYIVSSRYSSRVSTSRKRCLHV